MAGEYELIKWIRAQQNRGDLVALPAGDDLAILNWRAGDLLLVGTDQVLDGVHVLSRVHTPRQIGRKVMNRNLSDCAAMACAPAAAVVTVALPRSTDLAYAQELYLGMRDASDLFGCEIVGGDTASWDGPLALTVTILGRSDGLAPVRRDGAQIGDKLVVTGALGGSLLGRHLNFTPRVELARALARKIRVTAMIDVSDGLARDAWNLCLESGRGAVIDADRIPIHEDALAMFRRDGMQPLDHALFDGEDYELLYTTPDEPPVGTVIGVITEDRAVRLRRGDELRPLPPRGWEHRLSVQDPPK